MARYVEALFLHKIRFLALSLLAVLAAVAVGYQLLSFRASAVLEVEDPSSFGASFVPVGWSQASTPAENLSDMVTRVIKTSGFSNSLSDRLSTTGDVANDQVSTVVGAVVSNLKVSVMGSHLLVLSYSCHNHDQCVRVLADGIDVLRAQLVTTETDQAASISAFWSSQLKDAQMRLASSQDAVASYQAVHPGATVGADSTDAQAVKLYNDLQLWKGKVAEAQSGLTEADYLGSTSARLIQVGLSVVDPAHLTSSRYIGDGTSLIPAALVLMVGLLAVLGWLAAVVRMDHTARDPRLIERRLGVPVVATIPKLVGSRAP